MYLKPESEALRGVRTIPQEALLEALRCQWYGLLVAAPAAVGSDPTPLLGTPVYRDLSGLSGTFRGK